MPDDRLALTTEPAVARCKAPLRKAAMRAVEGLRDAIGRTLDTV